MSMRKDVDVVDKKIRLFRVFRLLNGIKILYGFFLGVILIWKDWEG